jgi:hypothetical protein
MNDWALAVNVRFRAQMVIIAERKREGLNYLFFRVCAERKKMVLMKGLKIMPR